MYETELNILITFNLYDYCFKSSLLMLPCQDNIVGNRIELGPVRLIDSDSRETTNSYYTIFAFI